MSYQVIIPKSVQKELDRLPKKVIGDILEKLSELTKILGFRGVKN